MDEIYTYTWTQFDSDCKRIAEQVKKLNWNIKYVYGPPRGGSCIAVKLSHLLGAKYLLKLPKQKIITSEILIVDDVSDTGKTLKKLIGTQEYKVATLFIKPQTEYRPHIYCRVVENSVWIYYPWEK